MTVINTVYSLHSCLSCPHNILKMEEEKETEKGAHACLLLTLTPHIDYTFSGLPSRTKHGDLSC